MKPNPFSKDTNHAMSSDERAYEADPLVPQLDATLGPDSVQVPRDLAHRINIATRFDLAAIAARHADVYASFLPIPMKMLRSAAAASIIMLVGVGWWSLINPLPSNLSRTAPYDMARLKVEVDALSPLRAGSSMDRDLAALSVKVDQALGGSSRSDVSQSLVEHDLLNWESQLNASGGELF
jgi:hypothetical protein